MGAVVAAIRGAKKHRCHTRLLQRELRAGKKAAHRGARHDARRALHHGNVEAAGFDAPRFTERDVI